MSLKVKSDDQQHSSFPTDQVKECLKSALVAAVKREASVKEVNLPDSDDEIAQFGFSVDSLVVVELLCAVESILDINLKDGIVQSGGYDSAEQAIEHLVAGIAGEWSKKCGEIYEPSEQ